MRVRWTAVAISDLAGIFRYIAKDDPDAARRTVVRIVNRVDQLRRTHGIGRLGRVYGTRELVVLDTPYLVPYRVKNGVVDILAVMHNSQRWPEGFG